MAVVIYFLVLFFLVIVDMNMGGRSNRLGYAGAWLVGTQILALYIWLWMTHPYVAGAVTILLILVWIREERKSRKWRRKM
jgi:hypothetical protein